MVLAAADTTLYPRSSSLFAIFAEVVVFPVPLTPTIINITGVSSAMNSAIVLSKSQYPALRRVRSAPLKAFSTTSSNFAFLLTRAPIRWVRRLVISSEEAEWPMSEESNSSSSSLSIFSSSFPPLTTLPPLLANDSSRSI